jgi:hypothetical protein
MLENGGNNFLLPPVITYADHAVIRGTSLPNSAIEIYNDSTSQGERFLGETKCDSLGNFEFTLDVFNELYKNVTALTIDNYSNTSGFSLPFIITGVNNELNNLPIEFKLSQNIPNPFNPCTIIKYSLPRQFHVTLKIYDILGNEVTTLVNEEKPAGNYQYQWNAGNLASGVYFYHLKAGKFIDTKKLILLK